MKSSLNEHGAYDVATSEEQSPKRMSAYLIGGEFCVAWASNMHGIVEAAVAAHDIDPFE
jgi:hypothetical protein